MSFVAVLIILSLSIFWMMVVNRTVPDAAPETVFTRLELLLLDTW